MKYKFDRRRALECKLLKKSKSYEGYYKYMVTIGEKDGTIHKQPAYGRDMQGALSRLLNKERTVKVERKLESNTGWIFLVWLIVMGTPAVLLDTQTPWFLVYIFGAVVVLITVLSCWYNYVNKGR
jgi:hypothetical protein